MKKIIFLISLIFILAGMSFATERTEGATFYIVIDKSISMEESGAFEQVKSWLTTDFIPKKIIAGDRLVLYTFYGRTEKVADIILNTDSDKSKLYEILDILKADGKFTDIGLAVETVRRVAAKESPGRLTSMIVITDLKQEADFSSPFAGVYAFQNRYMKYDKITSHGRDWYEISVRIPPEADAMAKQLYAIIANSPANRDL